MDWDEPPDGLSAAIANAMISGEEACIATSSSKVRSVADRGPVEPEKPAFDQRNSGGRVGVIGVSQASADRGSEPAPVRRRTGPLAIPRRAFRRTGAGGNRTQGFQTAPAWRSRTG